MVLADRGRYALVQVGTSYLKCFLKNPFILWWNLVFLCSFKNGIYELCLSHIQTPESPISCNFDAISQGEKQRESLFILRKSWPHLTPSLLCDRSLTDHKRQEVFLCDTLFSSVPIRFKEILRSVCSCVLRASLQCAWLALRVACCWVPLFGPWTCTGGKMPSAKFLGAVAPRQPNSVMNQPGSASTPGSSEQESRFRSSLYLLRLPVTATLVTLRCSSSWQDRKWASSHSLPSAS